MLYYLATLRGVFGPFRLFEYVTFRAGCAMALALLLTLLLGPLTVRLLKRVGTTAPTRLEGLVPEEYIDREKDKTPSMGGILIVFSIVVSTLLFANFSNPLVFVFLVTLLAFAALGFVDDYEKVAHHNRNGISSRMKLLFQFVIAVVGIFMLSKIQLTTDILGQLIVPFCKDPLYVSKSTGLILAFCALVVVGASNAVNLTDGKDGLAVGSMIFCTLTYMGFAYLCGHKIFAGYLNIPFVPGASEVVVFAGAIVGACIGFLWYNCYPASMFMGDTGSLALGGTIGLIAVLVKQEVTLVIVGGVFVIEALSVIIQVACFKLFGKRVFLCAPIHHHFERLGWTETQIVVRFWILSGIFALLGLATLKLR